jgi:tetratricopeptide (TPR) repeat protein
MGSGIHPRSFVEDPTDPDLVVGLASYDAKEWGVAEAPLRRAAERGNITAIFKLANVVDRLGRESEAVELWRLASAQGHGGATNNLALRLKKQGRRDEALALHRQSAESGNIEAMFNLALFLEDSGQMAEARQWYERAIEAGNGRAAAVLGRSLMVGGDRQEGMAVLERGVELGNLSAALMLAVDAQERDDYEAIVQWASRALDMPEDPNEVHQLPQAFGLLGFGLHSSGRHREAIEPLERAVALGSAPAQIVLDDARSRVVAAQLAPSADARREMWVDVAPSQPGPARYCTSCGEGAGPESRFCSACGSAL